MDRITLHRLIVDHVPEDCTNNVLYVQDECIDEVCKAISDHMPVWKYDLTRMDRKQIQMIRLGLTQHIDVSVYADYRYSYIKMDAYREHMREGFDVPGHMLSKAIPAIELMCFLADIRSKV